MRPLLRTLLTPIVAVVILFGGVSFAVACWHQTVPKAPDKVYPCIPNHTGGHGGDYGSWQVWFQWLKTKYGTAWANSLQQKYGSSLNQYLQDKYSGKTTTTYFGGSNSKGHGHDSDDCMPECPDGHAYKSSSTSTYGHHDDDDDDCEPDCPKTSTYTTSGYHPPNDDCKPDCPKTASYTTSTSHTQPSTKCDPPDASTGGCNTCKAASMTITGTVDPNGTATQYKFEFGTTPAFGNETDWTSAGDGTTAKSVSESIDSLAPGTKIYYRIVAKSIRGTANGATKYCQTASAGKPNAVTGSNTATSSTATINGTVDPNGASATAYFQWGKTSSLGSTTGSQNVGSGDNPQNASAGLSGLAPNTTYYYRVVGSNSKGTAYGDIKSFTTPADKPDAVTGSNTATSSTASINGTVDPNGASATAYFQWGKTSSLGTSTGSQNVGSGDSPQSTSAGLSGLAPNTTYYYRVVGSNSKGTDYGDIKSFTTPADKPDAVTGGNTAAPTSATIKGTADPNGAATTAYFQWGKTSSLGTSTSSQSVGSGNDPANVSAGLSGLTPGTTYYYRAVATNSKGTDYGDVLTFKTPADKPKCSTGGYGSLSKSGAKVDGSVNPSGGATTYYFEYGKTTSYGSKSGSVSAGSGISDVSASSTLSSLSSNTKYYYRVVAVNSEGTVYGAQQTFTTSK